MWVPFLYLAHSLPADLISWSVFAHQLVRAASFRLRCLLISFSLCFGHQDVSMAPSSIHYLLTFLSFCNCSPVCECLLVCHDCCLQQACWLLSYFLTCSSGCKCSCLLFTTAFWSFSHFLSAFQDVGPTLPVPPVLCLLILPSLLLCQFVSALSQLLFSACWFLSSLWALPLCLLCSLPFDLILSLITSL